MKECCQKIENREPQPSDKPDLTIFKCKFCGCRHFELSVDPGNLGIKGVKI